MKIAFALIPGKTVNFTPNHAIRMYIKINDALVEGSEGEDVFTHNGSLFPDTPLAATGRKAVHEPQFDLTAFTGTPGVPVSLERDDLNGLALWVDNNLILSQGELQTYYRLQATIDGREIPLPLHTPIMRIDWKEKGVFRVDLSFIAELL